MNEVLSEGVIEVGKEGTIRGNGTVALPVSCVEQVRWSYDSPRFSSKERVMSPSLRAMKSEQVRALSDRQGSYAIKI